MPSSVCANKVSWGGFICTGVTYRAVSLRPRSPNQSIQKVGARARTPAAPGVVLLRACLCSVAPLVLLPPIPCPLYVCMCTCVLVCACALACLCVCAYMCSCAFVCACTCVLAYLVVHVLSCLRVYALPLYRPWVPSACPDWTLQQGSATTPCSPAPTAVWGPLQTAAPMSCQTQGEQSSTEHAHLRRHGQCSWTTALHMLPSPPSLPVPHPQPQ
jgi:hypothetical protein